MKNLSILKWCICLLCLITGLAGAQNQHQIFNGSFEKQATDAKDDAAGVNTIPKTHAGSLSTTIYVTNATDKTQSFMLKLKQESKERVLQTLSAQSGATAAFVVAEPGDCANCTLTLSNVTTTFKNVKEVSFTVQQSPAKWGQTFSGVVGLTLLFAFVASAFMGYDLFKKKLLNVEMAPPEWDPRKSTALNLTLGMNVLTTITGLSLFAGKLELSFLLMVGFFSIIQAAIPLVISVFTDRIEKEGKKVAVMNSWVYVLVVFLTLMCSIGSIGTARSLLLGYESQLQFDLLWINLVVVLMVVLLCIYATRTTVSLITATQNPAPQKQSDQTGVFSSILQQILNTVLPQMGPMNMFPDDSDERKEQERAIQHAWKRARDLDAMAQDLQARDGEGRHDQLATVPAVRPHLL